jgi:hypothetical protein
LNHASDLRALLSRDPERSRILNLVQSLHLPDCWVGAGFVRSAVWDRLHRVPPSMPDGDVDVIWFDSDRAHPDEDRALERRLRELDPDIDWSVKNQSRMHAGNNDQLYASAVDALRFWPETATAVAVRQIRQGQIAIAAPLGLDDLFNLIVRPTPRFAEAKREIYLDRVCKKQWPRIWPRLMVATTPSQSSVSTRNPGQIDVPL